MTHGFAEGTAGLFFFFPQSIRNRNGDGAADERTALSATPIPDAHPRRELDLFSLSCTMTRLPFKTRLCDRVAFL